MTFWQSLLIFGSAVLAGGLNAIAGGGSFISFPVLIFVGIPPISANATSTVALWPGAIASIGAYRREFDNQFRELVFLCVIGLIGGVLGSVLLLRTPQATFVRLIPYLMLLATLLFAFSKPLTLWLKKIHQNLAPVTVAATITKIGAPLLQLAIATYGGFFGGGLGILLLATLALTGMENINTMNAFKTLLNAFINGVAVILFIFAGVVNWQAAALMAIGAIAGGYLSAHYAQKVEPILLRRFVVVVGCSMTLYFFVR